MRWRMGRTFHQRLRDLEARECWTADQYKSYQDARLRELVHHAYQNVPYYGQLFDRLKLTPGDIQTVADLQKIPILKKDMLREAPEQFIARNVPQSQQVQVSTSGTSGRNVRLVSHASDEYLYGGPFEWRFYRSGGYEPGDRCAVFRAHYVPSDPSQIYEFNPAQNKVSFSIFHLNRENLPRYVEGVEKYRPRIFNAYISFLFEWVQLMTAQRIKAPVQPKAIFTIGELVTDDQRKRVEDFFSAPILDWYGMEERVVIAAQCQVREGHHLVMDYGITELLPENNKHSSQAKRIIATGLTNFACPLIRYDTEDLAVAIDEPCDCGRM